MRGGQQRDLRTFYRQPGLTVDNLAGDVGAKHLIGEHAELVAEVEMDDDAILVDIDTPDALDAFRRKGSAAVVAPAAGG